MQVADAQNPFGGGVLIARSVRGTGGKEHSYGNSALSVPKCSPNVVSLWKAATVNTTRASLLIRIKDVHNAEAWTEFDGIYRPLLRRFATAGGLGESDMEDVVQDCMAAIHMHIEGFDYDLKKGRFRGWLRTVVNNRVRTLRKKRRHPVVERQELKRIDSREETPEALFDRMWMEEHLKHCLRLVREEVDERTFVAFRHYVMEEWPVETVCKTLGMTRNQVYKIKWRVTARLQERMSELIDVAMEE